MQRFPEILERYQGWTCGACGETLQPCAVKVNYLGSGFDIELLGCPKCHTALVFEELAEGKMREVEMILEDK